MKEEVFFEPINTSKSKFIGYLYYQFDNGSFARIVLGVLSILICIMLSMAISIKVSSYIEGLRWLTATILPLVGFYAGIQLTAILSELLFPSNSNIIIDDNYICSKTKHSKKPIDLPNNDVTLKSINALENSAIFLISGHEVELSFFLIGNFEDHLSDVPEDRVFGLYLEDAKLHVRGLESFEVEDSFDEEKLRRKFIRS